MSDRLSPQREAEIAARAEAATPGPWVECTDYGKDFYAYTGGSYLRGVGTLNFGDGEDAEADLAFTLNAPEDAKEILAELAAVRAERDEALENLTGAYLARWEEEQDNDRLRLALESARRGRRELRAEVAGMQVNYMIYRRGAACTINALRDELDEVRAEHDEAALMRDFTDFHLRQLRDQRGEAESANEAWELGKITAEEALRRTDAAIQNHKAVTLDQFRAERKATS